MKSWVSWSIALILLTSVHNLSGANGTTIDEIIQGSQQLLINGQYNQAVGLLENEIANRSSSSAEPEVQVEIMRLRGLLGDTYMGLYQNEKAIEQYDEIIKINPNFAFAFFMKGKTLARMPDRTIEALNAYGESERLGNTEPELYSGLAWCYKNLTEEGNLNEQLQKQYIGSSIYYYEKAIVGNPNNLPAIGNLADLQFNIGNFEEAIKYYESYTEQTSGSPPLLARMGDAYVRIGKLSEAIEILNEARAALPDINELTNIIDKNAVIDAAIRIHMHLGQTLTLQKKYHEAKKELEQLLALIDSGDLQVMTNEISMFKKKAQTTLNFFTHEPGFKTFNSQGHEKAGELNFSFDYPNGWVAKESSRANTLQVFWEYPSTYCDSIAIIVPPGQDRDKKAVTHERFKLLFENPKFTGTPHGTFALQKNLLKDYKYPAGFVDYFKQSSGKDKKGQFSVRKYMIYLGNQMIWVVFNFYPDEGIDKFKESATWMEEIIDSLEFKKSD
jgi:tetratricopeptide (TPR) repeat protein